MIRLLGWAVAFAATVSVMPVDPPSDSDLDRLAWLAGCWSQARPDGMTEEHWMKPAGGTMLGMSRTVRGGKTTEFEFLQIRVEKGAIAYIARPSGQADATFPVKTLGEREVVFENAQHDFPQRILYRRTSDEGVTARIEGTMNGKARGIDFPYVRCQ